MIEIRPIPDLNPADLHRLVTGYTSGAKFRVVRTESPAQTTITLELVTLAQPYVKRYDALDRDAVERYRRVARSGFSFGAFATEECVGLALAGPVSWNQSLWLWELHVAESHRRCGIGRRLVEMAARQGQSAGLRTLVCETQTTNVPAICFYRALGFRIEGIDLSYYSNHDYPDGEIAVFMKRPLSPAGATTSTGEAPHSDTAPCRQF